MNPDPSFAQSAPAPDTPAPTPAATPRPVDLLTEIYLAIGLPVGPATASARADLVTLFGCEQPACQPS